MRRIRGIREQQQAVRLAYAQCLPLVIGVGNVAMDVARILLSDPNFVLLPENLADPTLRAAIDKPPLDTLFEIRRRNLALQTEAKP